MVAVVILQPEEAEIAVFGSLPEPRYRPFPGSVRAQELEDRGEQDVEPDDVSTFEDSTAAGMSRQPFREVPAPRSLHKIGSAQIWRESSIQPALLVTGRPGPLRVVAVGTVEGRGRNRDFQGARHLDVRVRFTAAVPVELALLLQDLNQRDQTKLDEILEGELRPMSPKLGESLILAIAARNSDLQNAINSSLTLAHAERRAELQRRTHRPTQLPQEAMASALRFFSPAWHHLTPEPEPDPSATALMLENLAGVTENDYITDDASVFPGWDRSSFCHRGWWEFHNRDRRLLVKNINVSPAENRTGADLVYLRRSPDTFVLVQYKLLETLADDRLIYRPDSRLGDQVQRMLKLEDGPRDTSDDMSTYRLGEGFSFVKFVEPSAEQQSRPGTLTPGYYLPSEFVRRMLLSPGNGPKGGRVHYLDEQRHINPDTFARLVRDCWVGSIGSVTGRLREVLGFRDPTINLVLATDEPISPAPDS